jgi:ribonuclease VapC
VLAIIFREPEEADFVEKIAAADQVGIGSPSVVESGLVVCGRYGTRGLDRLEGVLESSGALEIEFAAEHRRVAIDAWLRYGRGRHPAKLNLGDCLAYATAKVAGRPLLCKGGDFAKTDIELA